MNKLVGIILIVIMSAGVYAAFNVSNAVGFAAMTMCLLAAIQEKM